MKTPPNENKQFVISTDEDFNIIYKKYHQPVFLNIKKIIHDEHYAMDIMQNVFEKLWQNRGRFKNKIYTEGWLFTVSYNESINFLRKRIQVEISIEGQNIVNDTEQIDYDLEKKLEIVQEAVKFLPPRKREIFLLSRFEGKSLEEICDSTNLSKNAIYSHLNDANKIIKRYVSCRYPELIHSGFIAYLTLC